jgi:hypothetical protein
VWETAGSSPQPAGDLFSNAAHNFIQEILVCAGSTAPIWRR